jgi:hypothetical protein
MQLYRKFKADKNYYLYLTNNKKADAVPAPISKQRIDTIKLKSLKIMKQYIITNIMASFTIHISLVI